MKTPLEKSIKEVYQIHDEIVVVIDANRLEREVLKGSLPIKTSRSCCRSKPT